MRPADIPQFITAKNVSVEQALLRNLINIMPGVTAPIDMGVYSDPQKLVVWSGLQMMRRSKILELTVTPRPGDTPEFLAERQRVLDALLDGKPVEAHVGGEHDDTWDREKSGVIATDKVRVIKPQQDPDSVPAPRDPDVLTKPTPAPEQVPPPAVALTPDAPPPAPAPAPAVDAFAEMP